MSDRAYLCISVCMLMCATAADGPEALAVRGAAAIPGTRLPRGGVRRGFVSKFEFACSFRVL